MSQNGQIQTSIETCTGQLLIIVTLNDAISLGATIESSCNRPDCKVVLLMPPGGCDRSAARLLEQADAVISEFTDASDLVRILDIVMLDMRVQSANLFSLLSPGRFAADAITVDRSGFLRHGAEDPASYQAGGRPRALSTSEMKVLRCLMNGDSNKLIARRHAIAEATVKVHVKAIVRKLNIQNRTQAAIWAKENGIPPADRIGASPV
ncbi:response regulator transcription factor [Methylobacterium nigriterrae]|uniref:response regulator transcription factor n=1 Tax=Methylobacterium nigriterrae TaxID=3127512 RepID=UPI003013AE44